MEKRKSLPLLICVLLLLNSPGCMQETEGITSTEPLSPAPTIEISVSSTPSTEPLTEEQVTSSTRTVSTTALQAEIPPTTTIGAPDEEPEQEEAPEMPQTLAIDLSLPKDTYHSGEVMEIGVLLEAPKEMNYVDVRVYGIYSRTYQLNDSKTADLKAGSNTVSFTYTTPACNRCAGIAAGTYQITAEAEYNGKVAATVTKDVNVVQ